MVWWEKWFGLRLLRKISTTVTLNMVDVLRLLFFSASLILGGVARIRWISLIGQKLSLGRRQEVV